MSSCTRSLMMDYLPWHFSLAESEDDHEEDKKKFSRSKMLQNNQKNY